ncbi:hypothetical protein KUTeg_023765 [Tegillarca granosa]|uniref:tRNA(Phe) (4-demethylwyosine(37)-C(7)) aminocarboxypropyltransferase n=1 Tax=Tegillarca granosa TaxID=220873 RepID=A0ABQ9E3I9_TEGGR|nr:hypothetical protein KUTeg_023765 [Tegillarca granosa]
MQCKGYWDETRKLKRIESGKVAIPVAFENETEFENLELIITEALNSRQLTEITEFKIDNVLLPPSKKSQIQTPHDKLLKALAEMLRVNKIEFTDELKKDVPGHWEVHGDLVLFPEKIFQCQIWKKLEPDIWRDIAAVFDCKKVAQKSVVSRDGFRTPQVTLLYGDNGWIHQVDNGLRIAKFNCEEEIVVDLYAGIGYFTIPYLVHAQAKYVHACEWNPDAVCPTGIAERVNLGLIPSSEPGWRVACAALNPVKGGILHIHNNVTSGQEYFNTGNSELNQGGIFNSLFNTLNKSCYSKHESDELLVDSAVCNGNKCLNYKEVGTRIHKNKWTTNILHIEHVKSYAPHIDHLVLDLECHPDR